MFYILNNRFLSGERGVMGPPGKMSVNEMNYIKEAMKGAKGDHGPVGAQGSTGERGEYSITVINC